MKVVKYPIKLDPNFSPIVLYFQNFRKRVKKSKHEEITIVVEREDGLNEFYETIIFSDDEHLEENLFYLEKLSKTLLWLYGGYKIIVVGPKKIYEGLKKIYLEGRRTFDSNFMRRVYGKPFEVVHMENRPESKRIERAIGKNLDGYRIGFDAGGSDMKVSAVVNGKPIFSTEIVWLPKLNSDPKYHKEKIRQAIYLAASKMPRVDALGVSSAGIYINNEAKVGSLFIQVPEELFEEHVKNIYIDIAKELNVPLVVANDGDVTALAGAMALKKNNLLGIAMGTSEAVGYINNDGNISGWLNELAFVPVDVQKNGPVDEWSGDIGVGCKYLSQDAVIRLAETCGIKFEEDLTLAERLKVVQKLDPTSETYVDIYETIGTYLAFGLAYYSEFYHIELVLLLGRVMSGVGGDIIVKTATKVLKKEFPKLGKQIKLVIPDEETRRVGQSIAAASLPRTNKS